MEARLMGKNRSQEVCKNLLIEKVSCEMRFEGGDGILYVVFEENSRPKGKYKRESRVGKGCAA